MPHAHIWCSDSVWFAWLSAFCTNLSTHWSTFQSWRAGSSMIWSSSPSLKLNHVEYPPFPWPYRLPAKICADAPSDSEPCQIHSKPSVPCSLLKRIWRSCQSIRPQ